MDERYSAGSVEKAGEGRVRANTAPEVNAALDREMEDRVRYYATRSGAEISRRIDELDREWSVERVLETEASSMGLVGVTLGATISRKFLVLPALVAGMVFLHAVQGWCPPIPVFRRLGVRTQQEIDRERYALKALRGDFAGVSDASQMEDAAASRAAAALRAKVTRT